MKNKVSIVIVTRNRVEDLSDCLRSISSQIVLPDELVIIDNNSSDNTPIVVNNYSKTVTFEVKYFKEMNVGFPCVYNRGLKEAKGDWVAFIDDDCVAKPHWYANIKKVTSKFPLISAVLGKSDEFYNNRILALTRAFIDETGKIGALNKALISDHEILDSKNVIYNKVFLTKKRIDFDEKLLTYAQGASEDCDLGMQIYLAGGTAIYSEKIRVFHKDPTSLLVFYKKLLFSLRNHLVYEKKWEKIRENIQTKRPLSEKIKLFISFAKRYRLNFVTILLVITNVILAYVITKTIRIFKKNETSLLNVEQI